MLLSTLLLFALFQLVHSYDVSSSYLNDEATAMDIHYSTSTMVLADVNYDLSHLNSKTKASVISFSTTHKASISTIAISPDASLVLTGSEDYTAELRYLANGSLVCSWNQLRGKITSSTILSDNARLSFVSQEGYMYYAHISNCSLTKVVFSGHRFTSVCSLSSGDEVWMTDYSNTLIKYDIASDTNTSYTIGTENFVSVMNMENTNYIGLCSQKAFYIIDGSGNVQYTLNYPSAMTKICRIMPSSSTQLYLTATTESQEIYSSGADIQLLWNIWEISITAGPTFTKQLIRQQQNENNRYGSSNSQLTDAGLFFIDNTEIYVASIAQGYDPYQNIFGDNSSSGCDTGTYDNGNCELCVGNVEEACSRCSNAPQCQDCYHNFYFQSSSKQCIACPANCYECSSGSSCQACQPGYVLSSSSCAVCNISGCINCRVVSGQSRCYECQIGYYTVNNKDCMECDSRYPGCLECDQSKCYKCDAGYTIVNTTTAICEVCSIFMDGCAACISQTYCDTCYDSHPYFDTVSSSNRTCKSSCPYSCLTCDHDNYDQCVTCDSNRTLSGTACYCKNTGFLQDPDTLACLACAQFIPNCDNCSSVNYCSTCSSGYYYDTTNGTHRGCAACNYSCASCSTEWDTCASCNAADNRVLNGTLCVCKNVSYFQYGNQTACQQCSSHLSNCDICYNETFCLTCQSGYFLNTISTGNNNCTACTSPCSECFGSTNNCTACASGRQLNSSSNSCECLDGYYSTGAVSCSSCSDDLGACESCTNNSVCLSCWQNNYFEMSGGKKICNLCSSNCQTCNTWTTTCGSCDANASRTLNALTNECDCMVGYTETLGSCLNCEQTFTYCTSCNLTHCLSCQTGYSLVFGGLKCVDCATSIPGCTLCLNGTCASCNATLHYKLSYSMCICEDGYYWKVSECLPYKMGAKVKRSFPVNTLYEQNIKNEKVYIRLNFQCTGLKFPYGVQNSVKLKINQQNVSFSYSHEDNLLVLIYEPTKSTSKAKIEVELIVDRVYDEDEYQPSQLKFTFNKNIYHETATYELATNFRSVYENYFILALRWVFSILAILGCADLLISLVFVTHTLPAFLIMGLSLPLPLKHALEGMLKIHEKSIFVFGQIDLSFEPYEGQTYDNHGIQTSLIQTKILDFVTLCAILLFYGIIGQLIYSILPSGKISKLWHYKFISKRYSTISLSLVCFGPIFLLSSLLNFKMQEQLTNQIINVGVAVTLITFFCIFVFVHSLILYSTQIYEEYLNEDCYMGTSAQEPKSVLYIISILIVYTWTTPLIALAPGYVSLSLVMLVLLWNIFFFKNWSFFTNKGLFFIKLFISVMFLLYVAGFLLFYIAEQFSTVQIATLEIVSLSLVVNILILLSITSIETILLFVLGIKSFCEVNSNLEGENTESQQRSEPFQEVAQPKKQQKKKELTNTNTFRRTNKKQHLKEFMNTQQNNDVEQGESTSKKIKKFLSSSHI